MIMTWQMASLLLLGGSTVLLFAGMPVAISFIAINLIGAFLFLGGDAGLHQVARNSVSAAINFSLTPIPLFILMGYRVDTTRYWQPARSWRSERSICSFHRRL